MPASKPKIAFFEFASCEGCQLTVVDSLQDHPELLDAVEIVNFREAISERGQDYQIAFIEGSCARPSDEERIKAIREQAALVVELGACAHLGGVNTIRNPFNQQEVYEYVYSNGCGQYTYESYPARPIHAVVKVDAAIPGCPIDRNEFVRAVTHLLQGRMPRIPDYPLCIECKLKENVCVYQRGMTCLGPIVRAGCDAICPTYGDGCEGCRGLTPNPNFESLKNVLAEYGLSEDAIRAKLTMFLTYQMMEREEIGDGKRAHV